MASKFYSDEERSNPYPNIGQQKKNIQEQNSASKPQSAQKDIFQKHNNAGNSSQRSMFLKQPEHEPKEEGCCAKCCACFSLEYYKDYFKVTNKDVTRRIILNLKFWSGGFFEPLNQEYDLYGPFWLYTTMVFVCSAVHNVLIYSNNPLNFAYDFQIIGISLSIFYILGMALSVIIGLLFGCLGLACKTSQIVCLYGYSMSAYVICVLLCVINMSLTTWLFLIYGASTKIAFILKNIFDKLEVPPAKKIVVLIVVIAEAVIQLFAIKFGLIVTGGANASVMSHFSASFGAQGTGGPMHLRMYEPIN